MVVVGFDPGSISFGVGILQRKNRMTHYIHSEEIKMTDKHFNDRMKQLWHRLEAIFASFDIEDAAIEEGYLGKNVSSMNLLAQVRGVALGFLIKKDLNLTFYSPRQVKMAVTGSGNAMKSQMIKAMKILLQLGNKELGSDESDALAVAYCHLLRIG
ncbi:MAG: crossover junction endodeoxyribonuclease RuvC [Candidatus Aminicenantes bacterium]|nr:crossover junction endodeoxyribonuclease RuvC [Candidatus Aminicenantes bacterium]